MNLGKETETLEFKKTTGEIKEAMASISSIINKHGIGTIYFGVKPNGDIVGQNILVLSQPVRLYPVKIIDFYRICLRFGLNSVSCCLTELAFP